MPDNEMNSDNAEMNETGPGIDSHVPAGDFADSAEAAAGGSIDKERISEPTMAAGGVGGKQDPGAVSTEEEDARLSKMAGGQAAGENITAEKVNKVSAIEFDHFPKQAHASARHNIDMLLDVTMPISIELGRTSMPIQDILNLGPGSVVELNKLAGEPVELLVNDKLIARGEVVVVDENFGIRITSMISQEERIKSLA